MPGSIQKRGDKYFLTISAGTGVGGKRKRFTRTIDPIGKTEAEKLKYVQKQLAIFIAEVEKGQILDSSKVTFEGFAQKWLKEYAEKNLAPKTYHRYKELLVSRIIPALGHIKLQKLKPTHLLEFYNNLTEDGIRKDKKKVEGKFVNKSGGLSEKTIAHHHKLISSMLQDAVEWELILDNPAKRAKPPKCNNNSAKKEPNFYSLEQTLALMKALESEPLKYRTIIMLTLYSGMREGELMGLEWSDIDFENKILQVRQASQYVSGLGTFDKDTKTNSSQRSISLPGEIIPLLKEYKAWQNEERLKCGDKWIDNNRLFTQWNGTPMYPYTPTAWFSKFIERKGLPTLTFHGLRHTHITLLIGEVGADMKEVSSRAGHKKTSTTVDIYAHSLQNVDRKVADKFGKLLSKKVSKAKKA